MLADILIADMCVGGILVRDTAELAPCP